MDTQISLQIGIDWADQKHDFCLCPIAQNSAIDPIEQSRESGVIASSAQHVHQWIQQLRKRFPGGDFEVCLELSKGQLINVLRQYDFIRIYPLNPISADSFRQSLYPSLRKDDATDAALLLEILQKHRGHLRQQSMAAASARLLEGLVQARRKSVDQRTALIQQLTSTLKEYYPQALDMIGEPSEPMSRAFLRKWPCWQELSKAREQTLRTFYYGHRSRSEPLIRARLEVKKNSCALTEENTVIELGVMQTLALVDQLEALSKIILKYDRKIKQLYDAHEKKALIDSLPGAGDKLGSRLLCAMESHTLLQYVKTVENVRASANVTAVPSSYTRVSLNGRSVRFFTAHGRKLTTSTVKRLWDKRIGPLFARWHLSGFASSTNAGKAELNTMKLPTWKR